MRRPWPETTIAALALAALPACSSSGPSGSAAPPAAVCGAGRPMPVAHIGPDVRLRVLCDGLATAGVASVDEEGSGTTSWSVSLAGDAAFSLPISSFRTCQAVGPTVALVQLLVPPGAVPGDAFDTTATIHADDGSFADGRVSVHADVTAPSFDLDPPSIDFGDVLPNRGASRTLRILDHEAVPVSVSPSAPTDPSFGYGPDVGAPGMMTGLLWSMSFVGQEVGDHTATVTWTAEPGAVPACQTTKTMTLHARVVAPDGGAQDGGAQDGGASDGGDAP
ncbi:MAG TPA: hypothetical protein VHL80_11025 [Polyangia bacterium]|nr:hypothetical protein [Polyangia bacterium]